MPLSCDKRIYGTSYLINKYYEGGSIGIALATAAFYPLERVRVELQSKAGDSRENDDSRKGTTNNDDTKMQEYDVSMSPPCTDEDEQTLAGIQQQQQQQPTPSSSPDSSAGSFELIPSINERSLDGVSMSFDEGDNHISEQVKSISQNNQQHNNAKPSQNETVFQCLLRLYQEQSLYKGASHVVATLSISNAVFFYALQVTKRGMNSLPYLDGKGPVLTQQNHVHQGRQKGNQHHFKRPSSIYSMLDFLLPKSTTGTSLLASSIAGCINVLLTNPLWVASLRIITESERPVNVKEEGDNDDGEMQQNKQQQQPNLWSVIQRIVQTEGISHLWNGTSTSLLLVSNPIIQHFLYEQLRMRLLCRKQQHGRGREGKLNVGTPSLSPLEAFILGAFAKAVATILTYPLQLSQVLLRLQRKKLQPSTGNHSVQPYGSSLKKRHDDEEVAYRGTFHCLSTQYSSGGLPALFQGLNAKLLQTVVTAAFTFVTYEQTLSQVGRVYNMLGTSNS